MRLEDIFESEQTSAAAFIADFRANSKQRSPGDPASAKARKVGDVVVTLSEVGDDHVSLSEISVPESKAGQGGGTTALRLVKSLANKHGVKVTGYAQAMNPKVKKFMTSKQLVQWYVKHGFTAKGSKITYTPS